MSDSELYQEVLKYKRVLDDIFYDDFHKSLPKFIYELKKKNIELPYNVVKFYYENQAITQIFKPVRMIQKDEKVYPIVSYYPFERVYIDTMYIKEKRRTLAFINIMDLFSKFAFSRMFVLRKEASNIESKKSVEVFQEFLIRIQLFDEPYLIGSVVSDMGSEFQGEFHKYLMQNDIKHYVVDAGNKKATSPIERFNYTLRLDLMRYRFLNNNKTNNEILTKILDVYNNSVHSGIGTSPVELLQNEKKLEVVESLNKQRSENYSNKNILSGYCRVLLNPDRAFKKIGANWSVDIYKIKKYNYLRNRYELEGTSKTYPEEQLQIVKKEYVMKPNIKIVESRERESIVQKVSEREKSQRAKKKREVLNL